MRTQRAALFMSRNLKARLTRQLETKGLNLKKEELIMEENAVEVKELVSMEENNLVPNMAVTLAEAKERIILLRAFVADMMVAGQDYGMIPGCPKPTLLKPGAEKLCDIFGFAKQVEVMNRLEDWEAGIFHYEVKVSLISKRTGVLEAEGIGSCNTKERKYVKQDPYTLINTMLKMAKKRALVDAVLSATRSSELFTQDLEDLKGMEAAEEPITKSQLANLKNLGKELGLSRNEAVEMLREYGVSSTQELSKKQAIELIGKLVEIQKAS